MIRNIVKDVSFILILMQVCHHCHCCCCCSIHNYRDMTTSSGACLSRMTAYLRTAGCVKLELSSSKASSTSIGVHCWSISSACRTSPFSFQFTHFRNLVRAWSKYSEFKRCYIRVSFINFKLNNFFLQKIDLLPQKKICKFLSTLSAETIVSI